MNQELLNIDRFKQTFRDDDLLVFRSIESDDTKIRCHAIFIQAMVDEERINEGCIRPIISTKYSEELDADELIYKVVLKIINCGQINIYNIDKDYQKIVDDIESGFTALLINNLDNVILVDTKGFKSRDIIEPSSETVVKGPREGFTEEILTNISMVRRKVPNSDLKFKFMKIGKITKTQICISYIDGICNKKILEEVKSRLSKISIDAILESEYIMELIQDEPLSPFHTIGSTERPDVVAAKLLEGKIVIFCDGTPFVLTMPYFFIENFHVSEDYYRNYILASFNRLLKILSFIITTSVPAIYISLVNYQQQLIPSKLFISIASAREGVPFPAVVEIVVMLIAFEILREAGTRLPKNIGNTVSIVGALILGEAAVEARLVSAPIIIVAAITGITGFTIPNMAVSVLVIRFVLLILSSIYGLYGYIWGILGFIMYLMSMRTFGIGYMKYLTDIKKVQIEDTGIRVPWIYMDYNQNKQKSDKILRKMRRRRR